MMTAQVEPYFQCVSELALLYRDHWEELALDKDKPEAALDPNWQVYNERDAAGQVLLITLRDTGQLVGYFLGFIAPGLHYKKCLTYHGDIFRVLPSHRGKQGGMRLGKALIAECKRRGVKRMFIGEKLHTPASSLLTALGFLPVERTYSRWIGD
jgi:GNAT superfamily N-acetyltransferase